MSDSGGSFYSAQSHRSGSKSSNSSLGSNRESNERRNKSSKTRPVAEGLHYRTSGFSDVAHDGRQLGGHDGDGSELRDLSFAGRVQASTSATRRSSRGDPSSDWSYEDQARGSAAGPYYEHGQSSAPPATRYENVFGGNRAHAQSAYGSNQPGQPPLRRTTTYLPDRNHDDYEPREAQGPPRRRDTTDNQEAYAPPSRKHTTENHQGFAPPQRINTTENHQGYYAPPPQSNAGEGLTGNNDQPTNRIRRMNAVHHHRPKGAGGGSPRAKEPRPARDRYLQDEHRYDGQ